MELSSLEKPAAAAVVGERIECIYVINTPKYTQKLRGVSQTKPLQGLLFFHIRQLMSECMSERT